ncbi:MAG: SRPBCC family protein [Actinomycetota bacterium]
MGIDVRAETEIARSPADVAAFAMEAENDTRWIGGIREARRLTPGPTAIGTRVERVAHFMGRRIEYVMEVAELEPDRRIALRTIKSPFPMRVTYAFEEAPLGTLASVRVEGDPAGFYKVAGGLMAPFVRRNIAGDVRRLKEILESG